jgi:hypothetical protein
MSRPPKFNAGTEGPRPARCAGRDACETRAQDLTMFLTVYPKEAMYETPNSVSFSLIVEM